MQDFNTQRVGQGQQLPAMPPHNENAFIALLKSLVHKIEYFFARYLASPDEKKIIATLDKAHIELINTDIDVNQTISKINQSFRSSISHSQSSSFLSSLKLSFSTLEGRKSTLASLQSIQAATNNSSIATQLQKEINLIDQELQKIDTAARSFGVELLAKDRIGQKNHGKYERISEKLADVQIGNRKVNVLQELTKRGISLATILLAFPNDQGYHFGGKKYEDDVETNLIRLYKALENNDLPGNDPKNLARELVKLRSLGIDPSKYLYKLSQKIKENKQDPEETRLSQNIHKDISWLSAQVTREEGHEKLLGALIELQSKGIDPIGALMDIPGVKEMNVENIIDKLLSYK